MSCQSCASSSCQCVVVGVGGVSVTGSGASATPYAVSIDICSSITALSEQDRPVLVSEWLVAQDASGNCIRLRSDNGVKIASVGFNATTQQMTITESDGSTYLVTLIPEIVVTTDGTGLGVVGTSPVDITIRSTDAGQILVTGADGGLFLECSAISPCLISTNSQNTAVLGTDGKVLVRGKTAIDTNSVNLTLVHGTPGTIRADVNVGCGLKVNSTGVKVDTLSWTYSGTALSGTRISCDTNGNLRGAPEHTCIRFGRPGAGGVPSGNVPVGTSLNGVSVSAVLVNPSSTRAMVGNVIFDHSSSFVYSAVGQMAPTVSTTGTSLGSINHLRGDVTDVTPALVGAFVQTGGTFAEEVTIAAGGVRVITAAPGSWSSQSGQSYGTTSIAISGMACTV